MTSPTPARRFPGWIVLAVLVAIVAVAAWIILQGPRR